MARIYDETHDLFRTSFRAFINAEMVPRFAEWEKAGITDRQVYADAAAHGFIGFNLPEAYGGGGSDDFRFNAVIDEEFAYAGLGGAGNGISLVNDIVGPYFAEYCNQEQAARWLPGMAAGELIVAVAMTEPGTGSDLAGIRATAIADGDEYIVNGSKIWSSGAHHSKFGILIARTDPDQPKHKGISYFICPMDTPGLTMSPIVDMTTAHSFNQVFFDDMRLPVSLRVGEEGDGWRLAKVTLSNERVSLSSSGSLWGVGPSAEQLLDQVRDSGGLSDPALREEAAKLQIDAELLRLNRLRSLSATLNGKTPGPEASILKIMADEHGQKVMALAKALSGTNGMLAGSGPAGEIPSSMQSGPTENNLGGLNGFDDVDPIWHFGYLFHPALTLGGGTFAVQRNIVAEHVLGLPREINSEQGMTWSEARRPVAG